MTKQIEIHGQRVQLYSLDEGHTCRAARNHFMTTEDVCCSWNYKSLIDSSNNV